MFSFPPPAAPIQEEGVPATGTLAVRHAVHLQRGGWQAALVACVDGMPSQKEYTILTTRNPHVA